MLCRGPTLERSEQWPCTLEDLQEAGGKNWPLNRIVDNSGETHHTTTRNAQGRDSTY